MPGIPGQYFRQFGLTVAIAVLFSLLVARLITPMMAAYLMRVKDAHDEQDQKDGWIMRGYLCAGPQRRRRGGAWFIPARYLTLVAAIGVLVVSVFFMLRIPGSFIPPEDVSRIPIASNCRPAPRWRTPTARPQQMRGGDRGHRRGRQRLRAWRRLAHGRPRRAPRRVTVLLDRLDHSLVHKLVATSCGRIPVVGPMLPESQAKGRAAPQSEIEAEIFAAR